MKVFLTLAVVFLIAGIGLARPEEDDIYNDEKIDSFNIDEVAANERLILGFANCFTGKANCTPDGKNIKKVIPHAMKEECTKCSPKLRKMIRKMMTSFRDKLPTEWEELLTTYDPKKQHRATLDKFLAETE